MSSLSRRAVLAAGVAALMVPTAPAAAAERRQWKRGWAHRIAPSRSTIPTRCLSGAYAPRPGDAATFGAARGRPLDIVTAFPTRDKGWAGMRSTWWVSRVPAGVNVSLAVPLWVQGGTLAAAASGAYDAEWRAWAASVRAAGFAKPVIRLGWEFNVRECYWKALVGVENERAWVQAWRRAARAIKTELPGAVMCWNVNEGTSPPECPQDPATVYPGDDVVDEVGLDSYDWFKPVTTEAAWTGTDGHLTKRFGWNHWASFARAHGKRFSLPEWGPTTQAKDNPLYMRKVREFIRSNPVAWEAIFADVNGNHHPFNATQQPNAWREYRALIAA